MRELKYDILSSICILFFYIPVMMGGEYGGQLDVLILDSREDGLGSDGVNNGGLVALLVDYLERKLFTIFNKPLIRG